MNSIPQRKPNFKHGMTGSPEYSSWTNMKSRCYNPNETGYKNYGGRGIKVDDRWLGRDGFVNFYEDMGSRPKGTSIERIDSDKDYSPENCRWATYKEQNNNRRSNTKITINGTTKNISQWCDEYGIKINTFINRINRGWIKEQLISTKNHGKNPIEINGVSKPIIEWCREYGIAETTMHNRIRRGWTGSQLIKKVDSRFSSTKQ